MTQVFGFILFILALVVHEAGHAIAMMRRGIEIKEAGIGIPLTGRFKLTLHPRFLPFPVTICPLLIGAYVMPTDRGAADLKKMSYKDQAICYAAGVIMNLAFAGALVAVAVATTNPFDNRRQMIVFLIAIAVTVAAWLLRRVLSVVVPVLGTAALVGLVHLLTRSPDAVGGPIEVVSVSVSSTTWIDALLLGGALSLSLALLNMLPLVPLDGGKVVGAFLQARRWHRLSNIHAVTTAVVFFAFFIFVIAKDIMSL